MVGCSGGGDFASAESADAAPDAIVELDVHAGDELARDVQARDELAAADVVDELDARAVDELAADAVDELDARSDVRDAVAEEAGPPPFQCKSIDGTGMCSPTGPWPYPCCRSSPCECCNRPNCGL